MRIVVIGDTLLDVDVTGAADRLSPDAPVPVVDVEQRRTRAGGAGLVATLLARDGYDVDLVTVLADDAPAQSIRDALVGVRVIAGVSAVPTPVKTRLRANGHPVARTDENCGAPPSPVVTALMLDCLRKADAVVVADYGRGLAGDTSVRAALSGLAGRVPIVWDPHPRGAIPVAGVSVVTPNLTETSAAAVRAGGAPLDAADLRSIARSAEEVRSHYGTDALIATLGSRGALLVSADAPPHIVSAPIVVDGDPCGAGDRFAASLVGQLARGIDVRDALGSAVAASAEFLAAGGVASLTTPANRRPLGSQASTALEIVRATRAAGGTVVATGGCFDLLHAGHARTLSAARALGNCLVVCLNSDSSVTALKGPDRPIMAEDDRVSLLLALQCVDAVVVFHEDTPETVLSQIMPDIWVKGGDYAIDDLPEAALVASWGGQTVTVPYYPGRSTTKLAGALARVG
jgi:D-beta-D-heptose 7-phosphate kinase/D-beta-D-heptose 1-phosphate adenosyltransferase